MPHSPTPWRAELAAEQILAANGRIVVYEMNTNEDDARMICVAVNSFEAMRAALRLSRRTLEVACGTTAPYLQPAFKAIDAALALAEQEP